VSGVIVRTALLMGVPLSVSEPSELHVMKLSPDTAFSANIFVENAEQRIIIINLRF
jgi:hypothetical protein